MADNKRNAAGPSSRAEPSRAESSRAESSRGESSRGESSRGESTRAQVPRTAVLAMKPAHGAREKGERWEDAVAVVSVRGELDRDALWAIDFTVERASSEAGRIVLDLLEVSHLDYAGVGELVARRRLLNARGGELHIAVKNPYVTNILKAAGGAELLLCRSVEEASGDVAVAAAGRGRSSRVQVHALPGGLRKKG